MDITGEPPWVDGMAFVGRKRETVSERNISSKRDELSWLWGVARSLEISDMSCAVAYRGFHEPNDSVTEHPLANSLSSYEAEWT